MPQFGIDVNTDIIEAVEVSQGAFFEALSGIDRHKLALDLLAPIKGINQAELLMRFTPLCGKRVLEIGSGLGINHLVWVKVHGVDGYGVEPDSNGFGSSYAISQRLLRDHDLNPAQIVPASGEVLPFAGDNFDVVYSTNVLEHTQNPERLMTEALRVLRPGGVLQLVYPNYRSFFDGHYAVFHPPVLWRGFFSVVRAHSIWPRSFLRPQSTHGTQRRLDTAGAAPAGQKVCYNYSLLW